MKKLQKIKTYTVHDSKRGHTFATLEEANSYERDRRKRTGEFCAVTEGNRTVTHTYKKR